MEGKTVKRVQVKIDDANNQISLIAEDLVDTNGQLSGLRSDFTVFSSSITATVSDLDADLNGSITTLQQRSDALEIGFNAITTDGVTKVDTKTGVKFDINGQSFDTTQSDLTINVGFKNNGQDAGIYVDNKVSGTNMMTANDDGVKAFILEVRGVIRLQAYEPTTGVQAVGLFWIGA